MVGRIGFGVWPTMPVNDAIRAAQIADESGVESVWVAESTLSPGRDAISILGAIAVSTRRIRVGTGIVNIFTRTPTLIASTVATLDEISGGRAFLGLGTGHVNRIPIWHSVKFGDPLGRMKEYMEIIRLLLAGETVRYKGKHVTIDGLRLGVKPVQEQIRIYIAAVGVEMAKLAGRIADGVLMVNCSPERAKILAEEVSREAAEASRRPGEVDVACYIPTFLMADYEASLKAARATVAGYGASPFYRRLYAEMGFRKEAQLLREAWERGDREAAIQAVPEKMAEAISIVGDEEILRKKLNEYRRVGVTLPVVQPYHIGGDLNVNIIPTIKASVR